ncbi:hypothetical protein L0U85_00180 [Glycomyces sp. L485]|nr:hypothetical protein [Glycomyces sp. L485]MCH7229289.1 hypothetical protein [Glycomyces sp. L485]
MSKVTDNGERRKGFLRDMTPNEWVELTIFVAVGVIALTAGINWLSEVA